MKKIYLLFLLAIVFSFNQINAQTACPEGAFVAGTFPDQQIIFTFDPGPGPDCATRPTGVQVDGVTTYGKGNCGSNWVVYDRVFGPGVADPNNFSVDYDGTICNYTGNLLPIGKFDFLNATLSVYPNPLTKNSPLNIKFAINTSAKIYMYDITGKLAMVDEIKNANSKQINTSSLTSGMYFMKLVTDDTTLTRKVIVMK